MGADPRRMLNKQPEGSTSKGQGVRPKDVPSGSFQMILEYVAHEPQSENHGPHHAAYISTHSQSPFPPQLEVDIPGTSTG